MEERLEQLLDGDKAIQLAQVAADAIKDAIFEDDSHLQKLADIVKISTVLLILLCLMTCLILQQSKAKQIVIDLYIKK